MGYEILEHTADIGLKIEANSLSELFAIAAQGMTSLLVSGEIQEKEKVEVALEAQNIEELFHDWLSEINYLFLVKQKIFQRFLIQNISPLKLQVICYGEAYDSKRHISLYEIKAVTYHQIKVREEKQGYWYAQVYFDL